MSYPLTHERLKKQFVDGDIDSGELKPLTAEQRAQLKAKAETILSGIAAAEVDITNPAEVAVTPLIHAGAASPDTAPDVTHPQQ